MHLEDFSDAVQRKIQIPVGTSDEKLDDYAIAIRDAFDQGETPEVTAEKLKAFFV